MPQHNLPLLTLDDPWIGQHRNQVLGTWPRFIGIYQGIAPPEPDWPPESYDVYLQDEETGDIYKFCYFSVVPYLDDFWVNGKPENYVQMKMEI